MSLVTFATPRFFACQSGLLPRLESSIPICSDFAFACSGKIVGTHSRPRLRYTRCRNTLTPSQEGVIPSLEASPLRIHMIRTSKGLVTYTLLTSDARIKESMSSRRSFAFVRRGQVRINPYCAQRHHASITTVLFSSLFPLNPDSPLLFVLTPIFLGIITCDRAGKR